MSDESKPREAKQKRTRSPAYPAIDLQTAIARAAALWTKINRHPAALDSIAGYWGYEKSSSRAMSEAAAMIKYGLLSDEGTGASRTIKLTGEGIKLSYNPDKSSPDYLDGLKKAALCPAIHQELWARYQGSLPDDAVIKRFLVVDKKFNEQYVDEFISQFRRTIEFSKLSATDMDSGTENSGTEETMKLSNTLEARNPGLDKPATIVDGGMVKIVGSSTMSATPTVLREFAVPLSVGTITLRLPYPMDEDDFQIFLDTLTLWKKQLVKKPEPKVETKWPKPPFVAIWKNKLCDKMVKIIEEMGEQAGVKYYKSEDGTGIPAPELFRDIK